MTLMEELLKNQLFATHAIAAAGSVTLSTGLTYPLDTLKTLIQVGLSSSKPLNALQALRRVQSVSGISGLYSGFTWLNTGRILSVGARFGIFEIMSAFYKDGREDSLHVSEAFMAGILSGAAESLICSPFELIKLRAQVSSAMHIPTSKSLTGKTALAAPAIAKLLPKYVQNKMVVDQSAGLLSTLTSNHAHIVSALQKYPWMITGSGKPPSVCDVKRPSDIISLEGWSALWRGLRSGLVRDSVFGGMFFSTWQFLHRAMLDWKAVGMDPIPSTDEEIGPLSPIAVSFAAGISGSVAAAASHCFDTAKTRSLCTVLPKYVTMERRFLKWNRPGTRFERYTGIHPSDRNLLFQGIRLRMTRSGVASFILVGGYFLAIDQLSSA